MADLVPFPSDEYALLADAIKKYGYANDILNSIAGLALFCSLLTLIVMVKLKVYEHPFMRIIFFMTILQTLYDASLFSFYCGDPYVTSGDEAGFQTDTWTFCKSAQIGVIRCFGVCVGICTNLISACIAYVIFYMERLSIGYVSLFLALAIPGLSIGICNGLFFADQTVGYGLKGFLGGIDDFNYANFVYIYTLVAVLVINVLCVLYILWHFATVGLMCRKKASPIASKPSAAVGQAPPAGANTADQTESQNYMSWRDSPGESLSSNGPEGNKSEPDPQARSFDAQKSAHRVAFPMFLLAKRLMWYPLVQCFVIFGSSYFAFAQGGEAFEGYMWNVVENPKAQQQTMQLYLFSFFMPLSGVGYFFVFMTFQRDAWRTLLNLLFSPLIAIGLMQPFLTEEQRQSAATNRGSSISSNSMGTLGDLGHFGGRDDVGSITGEAPEIPNLGRGAGDNALRPNGSSLYAPPDVLFRTYLNNGSNRTRSRDNESQFDYAYEDPRDSRQSSYASHRGSSFAAGLVSVNLENPNPSRSFRFSKDSVTYYQDRISTFRDIAKRNAQLTVGSQLASLENLEESEMEKLQENELIELIESAAKKQNRIKSMTVSTVQAQKRLGQSEGSIQGFEMGTGVNGATVKSASSNPMH